jgi:3-oxoacyl-[acyl-carrier protein] reductase
VAVHYHRSADQAERVVKDIHAGGGRAVLLQGDVGDPAVAGRLVADTVAAFGRLDVLINNAGGPQRRCEFVDTSDALYDELMNLNLRSVFATCLAPHGIRVNAISPGVVLSPIHERLSTPAIMEAFLRSVPMGRAAAAEECVGAFLFLASERLSSYVTGQILEVNGGQFMP